MDFLFGTEPAFTLQLFAKGQERAAAFAQVSPGEAPSLSIAPSHGLARYGYLPSWKGAEDALWVENPKG